MGHAVAGDSRKRNVISRFAAKIQARIPLDRDVDYHALAWAPDGRVVALASGAETTLWKFTPEAK